ncbi:MAG TPA: ABC transporter substrate-binding protein [Acidocella sp.]|jgi:putative hydroxymethylpyrimidine transport system substrate-binding protein|uniref:ABC transporter substrate-binding protein n=1 Tax=Acidocella sp. TaxID=50710 RepID=UPI002CDA33D7|nr:ABC transporter substrate-binding protein [Acidocella sp.]HVE21164.1 ABC transporter substrate-binding protein [Acidocella sp.]
MKFDRRSFLAAAATSLAAPAAFAQSAAPKEKFTVILDWFVNPDHAPLFAARYSGAFDRAGLDVVLVPPTDPDLPPRLLAAGKADAALSYQTQLYLLVDQGLPLRRTGTLIDKPLNTLTALGRSGITKLADLKGRKIGYSVAGVEEALIGTMLRHAGLGLSDVTLVNVNFELVTALMSNEVDAVIGTYRTYEDIQLAQAGLRPVIFLPEDYGVPPSDELILLSNTSGLANPALPKFLAALKQGANYLAQHPDEMLARFLKDNPNLNDKLDIASWKALPGSFAQDPAHLDAARYTTYRDFMVREKLIKTSLPLEDYAVQIKV